MYSFYRLIVDVRQSLRLLIWINYVSNIDKYHIPSKVCDEVTYPFWNFNVAPSTSVNGLLI